MKRLLPVRCLSILALPMLLMASGGAQAQSAASKEECEKKYSNALEFNLCLASLSPVRGRVNADPMPEGADQKANRRGSGRVGLRGGEIRSVRRGGRVSSTVYVGGAPVQRTQSGRKRITFDVRR